MRLHVLWRLRSIPVVARMPGYVFDIVTSFLWAADQLWSALPTRS